MNITRSLQFTLRLTLTFGLTAFVALTTTTAVAQLRPSIADLQAQIDDQATQIATLQSQVATDTIPNVAGYVTMDVSTPNRPVLRLAGANLQIVNGLGSTDSSNGIGNLIVGYDEVRTAGSPVCSLGLYIDQPSCETNGGTWSISHKSGSHNVVIGWEQNYSRYGGLVAGFRNNINGAWASVSGGLNNSASRSYTSVSGGQNNTALGSVSSVSGGLRNTASGIYASVSGGEDNQANAHASSVSGGANRSVLAADNDGWRAGGLSQDN